MTIKYHFKHEGGVPHGVTLPNNFHLAYRGAKAEKANSIAQSCVFLLLFCFLVVNTFTKWLPVAQGMFWYLVSVVGVLVSECFLVHSISWKGPIGTLLFVIINTDDFEEYIIKCCQEMEKMLDPINRAITFMSDKEARQISRELMTAETIRQILTESNQITDLYDAINFVVDNSKNLYGFIIGEVKNVKRKRG